jgi:hypothetical protein
MKAAADRMWKETNEDVVSTERASLDAFGPGNGLMLESFRLAHLLDTWSAHVFSRTQGSVGNAHGLVPPRRRNEPRACEAPI